MKLRFVPIESAGDIEPFAAGLRALEREITYPLEAAESDGSGERFFIDHGARYHPFFSAMGEARFLVVSDGDTPLGVVAGVWRRALAPWGESLGTVYAGDLKLAPSARGHRVGRQIAVRGLLELAKRPYLWDFSFIYGAAMRGAKGDVRRSFRGLHPGRLCAELGRLSLYFVPAARLAELPSGGPLPPSSPGLELTARDRPLSESTAGRKDLRLASTGALWPLVHLPRGPTEWTPDLGEYLREAGAAVLCESPSAIVCFAVDERLCEHSRWLAEQGLTRGATSSVIALASPKALWRINNTAGWLHLATSEI